MQLRQVTSPKYARAVRALVLCLIASLLSMSAATLQAFAKTGAHHSCVAEMPRASDTNAQTTAPDAHHNHDAATDKPNHPNATTQAEDGAQRLATTKQTDPQHNPTPHDCVHCSAFLISAGTAIEPPSSADTKVLGPSSTVRSRVPPRLDRPPKLHA